MPPDPISLCVENLEDESSPTRFIRCVALAGNLPGLGINRHGRPLWGGGPDGERACELWVSADARLMLWRSAGGPAVILRRASRSLHVPEAKPVVVLDQDEVEIAQVRLRLHVHGPTTEVHPPMPFFVRSLGAAAVVATALAAGAAAAGCERPNAQPDSSSTAASSLSTGPASTVLAPEPSAAASTTGTTTTSSAPASTGATTSTGTVTKTPPIEVRPHPPKPASTLIDRNRM